MLVKLTPRSLSFIFALAGMAFFLLPFMYLIVDVKSFWSGTPLIYVGMNPILVRNVVVCMFLVYVIYLWKETKLYNH